MIIYKMKTWIPLGKNLRSYIKIYFYSLYGILINNYEMKVNCLKSSKKDASFFIKFI